MEKSGTVSRPVTCTNMETSGAWGGSGATGLWTDARWPGRPEASLPQPPASPRFIGCSNLLPGWVLCWLGFSLLSCYSSKINALTLQPVFRQTDAAWGL